MPERSLATAVSLLGVSETISVALIEDLRSRCTHPTIRAVLDATLADEDTHRDFGWDYIRASLSRFDDAGRDYARLVAAIALEPHVEQSRAVLARIPIEERRRDAWPDTDLIPLGLLSDEREAVILDETIRSVLTPKLAALGIAPTPAAREHAGLSKRGLVRGGCSCATRALVR
jgi:hypothetical protein